MTQRYTDKTLSLSRRKTLYREKIQEIMNPIPEQDFDPENFEPIATEEEKDVAYRVRVKPGKVLPTFGLNPKELFIGQMIGMFESKQDIYLLLAHRCNDLQVEVDTLRSELDGIKRILGT